MSSEKCHRCGQIGHRNRERQLPRPENEPIDDLYWSCGNRGHYTKHCTNADNAAVGGYNRYDHLLLAAETTKGLLARKTRFSFHTVTSREFFLFLQPNASTTENGSPEKVSDGSRKFSTNIPIGSDEAAPDKLLKAITRPLSATYHQRLV